MVGAALLVCLPLPGTSTAREPRGPRATRAVLRQFLPPNDRDFLLAFCGRFVVIMALFTVTFYQLYLYTDLLGLSEQQAGQVIARGLVITGATALIMSDVSGWLSDRIGRRKLYDQLLRERAGVESLPACRVGGKVMVTISPPPVRASSWSVASCAWTMLATMARPRPWPCDGPARPCVRPCPRTKGSVRLVTRLGEIVGPVFSTTRRG
jgi:hypothetical protein